MRLRNIFIGLFLLGVSVSSCAPSGPTTLEVLESLETQINARDMEGVMALFAKDAVVEETFWPETRVFDGTEGIEFLWSVFFLSTNPDEFRDISIDGNNATFTWASVGPAYTKLWPTVIEVRNGKITYMDFYEEPVRVPAEED